MRTISKVTWSGAGTRNPVVETSLISPPAGGALIVKIINAKGGPVAGMPVTAKGPSPSSSTVSATTGIKGCVIFAGLAEGEYTATASETGWVNEKSGGPEPLPAEQSVTIAPGTTATKAFAFDRPGALAVSFAPSTEKEAPESDTFVAQNTGMPTPGFRWFGTLGTYAKTVTSPTTLFPFAGAYTVYAGTCEMDEPSQNNQPESSNPGVNVLPGETASVTVPLPAVNIKVMSGSSAALEGLPVGEVLGSFEDTRCKNSEEKPEVHKFPYTATEAGELHKGMSFGIFSLCVASKLKVGTPTAEYRKLKGTVVENKNAAGSSLYTIYLGSASAEHKTTSAYTCP